jgi:Bifunctional DNA primase/polymerase, N-terminal
MALATITVQSLDLAVTQSGLFHTDRQAFNQQLVDGMNALPEEYSLTPIRLKDGKPTKAPSGAAWQKTESDRATIATKIRTGSASGIGIKLGEPSGGIVALDIDGLVAQEALKAVLCGDSPPETVTFTSGKPGCCQYLFKVPTDKQDGLRSKKETHVNEVAAKGEDLDFRWTGEQSLLPPSAHPETAGYYWVDGCSPNDTEIAELPEKLLTHWLLLLNPIKVSKPSRNQVPRSSSLPSGANKDFDQMLAAAVDKVANQIEGGRNALLNTEAYTLAGLFPDKVGLIRAGLSEAAIVCGLDLKDIEATLNSALTAGALKPIPAYAKTDKVTQVEGMNILLDSEFKNFKYNPVDDQWLQYKTTGYWVKQEAEEVLGFAQDILIEQAPNLTQMWRDSVVNLTRKKLIHYSNNAASTARFIPFQNGVLEFMRLLLVASLLNKAQIMGSIGSFPASIRV